MKKWYPYTEWEDFQNGMYETPPNSMINDYKAKAKIVLTNPCFFYGTGLELLKNWPIACSENLTGSGNKRAWLGQAACCYLYRVPEIVTRIAWGEISFKDREAANQVADQLIKDYEAKNNKVHTRLGSSLLF